MTARDHHLASDYALFEVRFNVKRSGSDRVLYTAAVHVVGTEGSEVFRTAEVAARSWGAFQDPDDKMAFDHHFHDREFEPISAVKLSQVDGISGPVAAFLSSASPKMNWD